jgi:hypothetical protein
VLTSLLRGLKKLDLTGAIQREGVEVVEEERAEGAATEAAGRLEEVEVEEMVCMVRVNPLSMVGKEMEEEGEEELVVEEVQEGEAFARVQRGGVTVGRARIMCRESRCTLHRAELAIGLHAPPHPSPRHLAITAAAAAVTADTNTVYSFGT